MNLTHVLYSGLGGHGSVFFSFADGAAATEVKNSAVFYGIEPMREGYAARCEAAGVPYTYVPKKPGLDRRFFGRIYRAIRQSRPGAIFLHGSINILPAAWYRLRHGGRILVRETQANHLKTRRQWFYLVLAMALANRIVFLSEEYRADIASRLGWYYRLWRRKVAVVPNGLDLSVYRPGQRRPGPGGPVFGMQSRLVAIKDHATMLDAFAAYLQQHGPATLRIAGDGPEMPKLRAQAKALGIEAAVTFTGMLPEDALVGFLHGLDIYIHATLGETMSTAIMQAMACGLPIIASRVPGVDNMIQDESTGLLVPAKDALAMTAAMHRVAADSALSSRLAAAALAQAAALYSNERMRQQYFSLFRIT